MSLEKPWSWKRQRDEGPTPLDPWQAVEMGNCAPRASHRGPDVEDTSKIFTSITHESVPAVIRIERINLAVG